MDPATTYVPQDILNPQSFNTYGYAEGNPVMKVDPDGKEPKQGQLATLSQVVEYITYKNISNYQNQISFGELAKAFGDNVKWDKNIGGGYVMIQSGSPRYIYTENSGWIDMQHFFGSAEYTQKYGKNITLVGGYLFELLQEQVLKGQKASGFSYEDITSNYYGAQFSKQYSLKIKNGDITVQDAIYEFFNMMEPKKPIESPNIDKIPFQTNKSGPSQKSNTVKKKNNKKKNK